MTWVVPDELEAVVYAAARGVVGEAPLATPALVAAIVDRSKRYTSDRGKLAAPANKTADLAARAVFFTLADAMKVAIPLAELANRDAIPPRRPLRIVDIGAGCGAMSLGLVAHLVTDARGAATFEILAIDHDVDALRIAGAAVRGLAEQRGIDLSITTRAADVETTSIPPCDIVLIGTVLNELSASGPSLRSGPRHGDPGPTPTPPRPEPRADARLALVERALGAIAPDGAVIVIEPALRETSRALHELRDAILAKGAASVFAPCTRRVAPCPMLANPDDWCHEDRAIKLPRRTAELARLTHLRDSGMKFSYLVLRHSHAPLVDAPHAWRVVSAPRPAKGKLEIVGCGDAGRVTLRLLKRNRAEANRAFERARRGDVLIADAPAEEDRVELGGETVVSRVEPAGR